MEVTPDLETNINIEDEMRQSYIDYAMSVIIGRALPDVRDGLKPVQRRILYAMYNEGLVSTHKTAKCAGVVGSVLKYFHPHGDIPVYDALVRLAQSWNLRYMLVEGQGNFGSVDGDPPAAYRYTECRMTAASERLLEDIDKNTVQFAPNFDDSTKEPIVLPSIWPNLVVNGADGIAVGMATHIPPHNLCEVVDAVIALIANRNLSAREIMHYLPGPDFPTGGIIYGRDAIHQAYSTGRGVLKISAKTHIEQLKKKSREVEAIIVTEIPYQLNKARLIERIAELVNDKNIDGISQIRDESDRKGMRIVIELKKDATSDVVLNQLYKMTPMRSSFGVINLAIVAGKPVVCTMNQLLGHFVDHRRDVVTRRTEYLRQRAEERLHLLDGFRTALLNLDEVIQLIRGAETPKEAKEGLQSRFALSEIQAQAILDLRLQKLTGMERLSVEQEHAELLKEIARYNEILSDIGQVDKIIITELTAAKEKFGDARRTAIEDDDSVDIDTIDLIENEEMVITVSDKGYIKRTSVNEFRAQKRGGKGVTGAASKEDDYVEHLFVASTHDDLLAFTSLGRLHWLKVYEIPEAGRTARGRALVNLLHLKEEVEGVRAILPVKEFKGDCFVFMTTQKGFVKKMELMEFSRPRKGGIVACTLDEGDALIGASITSGSDDVIIATRSGKAIRFSEADVRPMGRAARGVIGIRMDEGDIVVGMSIVAGENQTEAGIGQQGMLLTVCENGYGKRTALADYRTQGRGGQGVIDIQTADRNGPVVNVCVVDDNYGLMIITSSGKIIRINTSEVSVIGRNTKGVRLINLDENEKVVAVTRIMEEGEETVPEIPGEGGTGTNEPPPAQG